MKKLTKFLSWVCLIFALILLFIIMGIINEKFVLIPILYMVIYLIYMRIFEPKSKFWNKWY